MGRRKQPTPAPKGARKPPPPPPRLVCQHCGCDLVEALVKEQRQKARLNTAAPALLKALRLCRDAINEEIIAAGSHPTIRRHAKAAEQADAAIAKAEGL